MFTLYSKSLPLDVASRAWDVFCRDGEEVLFRTALGKCSNLQPAPNGEFCRAHFGISIDIFKASFVIRPLKLHYLGHANFFMYKVSGHKTKIHVDTE
jgi:hypothetical protein